MKKLFPMIFVIALLVVGVTSALAAPVQQAEGTIVDIAVADGRFTTLVTALQAAELVDTLNGEGPFTVFAPTDEAFAALPAGTLDSLLADPAALTDVLLYHVVPGKVMAAEVVTLESADTALGASVSISVEGSTVKVNDAQVIIPDIEGSNGVIHVIDQVLVPAAETPAELPSTGGSISTGTFNAIALAVAGLMLLAGGAAVLRFRSVQSR